MTQIEKQPSERLVEMMKEAAGSLLDFADRWAAIKKKGNSEGYSEKELQEMLRPHLKQRLNTKQVWYLFHKEEQKERSREQYDNAKKRQDRTNISTNDVEKVTEQSDISQEPDKEDEEKVEQKLESVGVDLKQERINELENQLQLEREEKEKALRDKSQIAEALKKTSFKTANDPDNLNEEYDSKIAIPMLITKLRGKMGSGWHFVENRMRYIS